MVSRLVAVAALLVLSSGVFAATSTARFADGRTLVVSAARIDGIGPSSTTLVLSGTARVKLFDPAAGSMMDASAEKIVVVLGGSTQGQAGVVGGVLKAELTGSPSLLYEATDPDTRQKTKTTASSSTATFDGTNQTVQLKGNVRITNENPAIFEGPAEMTGDEATLRLGAKLGPDEVRFRISSAPGESTMVATPKSNTDNKGKK